MAFSYKPPSSSTCYSSFSSAGIAPETSKSGQDFGQRCEWNTGLRTETLSVFGRVDEGLYHFGLSEIAFEAVQFVQPEVGAVEVQSSLRRIVRVPAQVTEVLHQHKGAVEFLLL